MNRSVWSLVLGSAAFPWFAATAQVQPAADTPERVKSLGVVTVTGGQPSSLPAQIPATLESMTREEIGTRINATDSEDALKYLPSLLVRKRYIGDYNHAILSTRASGAGNSARSAVYADGIPLSNYLGNGIANGTNYAPRWGLVSPEEIERVDVMYGPFSAAYPGNSAGAVVDYVTRMPTQFEAHVSAGHASQPNDLYRTRQTFASGQAGASLGGRSGDWSWWLSLNRTDSHGQPLTFATAAVSSGRAGGGGTPVAGYVEGRDTTYAPWYILGAGTAYHTVQDQAKLKLAYDFSPTVRATYTLGGWRNTSQGRPQSYLTDVNGLPVHSGRIAILGRTYTLAPAAFALTRDEQTHLMHGLSVKSRTQGVFDWEVAASLFDYRKDRQRAAAVALPLAAIGGAGTLQDQDGTGWTTLAAKGTWRPDGPQGAHIVDFGIGRDAYRLSIAKHATIGRWIDGPVNPHAPVSVVGGRTRTASAWAQHTWRFAPAWKAVLGLRWEGWEAHDGLTATAASGQIYAKRSESHLSPKAALAWTLAADTVLKAAVGRAVRFPTVGELYGATSGGALSFINDPTLKPEQSWTSELSLEKDLGHGLARATLFHETTRDALFNQRIPGNTISRVQNIDKVRTTGFEWAYTGTDVADTWGLRGLDLGASLTYADSKIAANAANPASVGKWQPRVPRWRAAAWVTYRPNDRWAFTVAARHSGRQYATLDNSDVNADTYFGVSRYFTVDLRVRYRITRQWSAALGIDNANNARYWNFHPYPQRTYTASVKWTL